MKKSERRPAGQTEAESADTLMGKILLAVMTLFVGVLVTAMTHLSMTAKTGAAGIANAAPQISGTTNSVEIIEAQPLWLANARPFNADENEPLVAVIVLDPGEKMRAMDSLLTANQDITPAVAHDFERGRWRVGALRKAGHEVLALLPTDYAADFSAHPNVLRRGLGPQEMRRRALWHLAALPGVVGGMDLGGGDILEDEEALGTIVKAIAETDTLFVNARSNGKSLVTPVARAHEVPVAQATLRIGMKADQRLALSRLSDAQTHAEYWGYAVVIVEPGPEALAAVESWLSEFGRPRIAPVSAIVKRMRKTALPADS